ncbi:hypothetical protein [uncultured Paraglaciecola sp.]|uniref:hypothetical protein n=1 Tax=uncultured Paraglaciecola sp. TaxID=1765024 RepID=UPI0026026C26|nr:hypothetical protein [uncultured Paraglaciecola sp.]
MNRVCMLFHRQQYSKTGRIYHLDRYKVYAVLALADLEREMNNPLINEIVAV